MVEVSQAYILLFILLILSVSAVVGCMVRLVFHTKVHHPRTHNPPRPAPPSSPRSPPHPPS